MLLVTKPLLIARASLTDFIFDWRLSICFVFALAAVLAPLLVLFGLKFGVVTTLLDRLNRDPHNREIIPIGSGQYSAEWIASLEARVDVGFAIPRTRIIAATISLRSSQMKKEAKGYVIATLIPTKGGDPLLAGVKQIPRNVTDVTLSSAAAQRLGVRPGDIISGAVSRTINGKRELAHLKLSVVSVLSEASYSGFGAFAPLDLLLAVEDFKDGRAVPRFGWRGKTAPNGERTFATYRLFARNIYDVATLRDDFRKRGIDVYTRAAEIERVQSLERNLTYIFWVVAGIGITGYLISLAASLWANVDRKRGDLSALRLMGFTTGDVMLFPVIQATIIGVLGSSLAVVVYYIIEKLLNSVFLSNSAQGEVMSKLHFQHSGIAVAVTCGCAIISSSLAAYRAALIEPAEGLRNV